MTNTSLLYRQISPAFFTVDRVQSPAFKPSKKDNDQLSVDDGEVVTAEKSWVQFTGTPGCRSAGVMAVTQDECTSCKLTAVIDQIPHPSHGYINFHRFES